MFERRLKIFLAVLVAMTLALVLRAAYLQVLRHGHWERLAQDLNTHRSPTETMRGTIRDVKNLAIATDEQCVDACFDYRALAPVPDEKWVTEVARARLRDREGAAYTEAPLAQRKVMVEKEVTAVRADLRDMWKRLAEVTDCKLSEIEDVRTAIVAKVKMRRRFVWYYNYADALKKHQKGVAEAEAKPSSMWQKWLLDDTQDAPVLDNFELRVFEETAPHPVVRDIKRDVQTELWKHSARFPGLVLKEGNRRFYPFGRTACHLLGRVTKVTKDDTGVNDPYFEDELRQYRPDDLKGRGGLEQLCERELRGVRGEIRVVGGREVPTYKPERGKDVKTSIDIELQQEVEELFEQVPMKTRASAETEYVSMLGAAVVIDVPTGEVRVLASAPGFDPNQFEEQFSKLNDPRNLRVPLLNRATSAVREPGSTVKPIVGIAAAATGVRRPDDRFECIGYMVVNGKPLKSRGRCWVTSMFHKDICGPNCQVFPCPNVAHHPTGNAPHPTGYLTLADAVERSCNPYFETIADTLGPDVLSDWFDKFGLGRPTGIGLGEAWGRIPVMKSDKTPPGGPASYFWTWTAGIGQGPVGATPLQMANVAATIARGGVWLRPTLIAANSPARPELKPGAPTRLDLGLPPDALRAVRDGMFRVVNSPAGSGSSARRKDLAVAGKTGTAEAAQFLVDVIDPLTGKPALEEYKTKDGRVKTRNKKEPLKFSNPGDINPEAPWYRGTGTEGGKPNHSWFVGYAPAEDPQIAFAVLVEYGGAGGGAAGSVAAKIVQKCIEHGTLKVPAGQPVVSVAAAIDEGPSPSTAPATAPVHTAGSATGVVANRAASVATPLTTAPQVELLHDIPPTTRPAR